MNAIRKGLVWVIAFPAILCGVALLPLMVAGFVFSSALSYGFDWAVFMQANQDLEGVKLSALVIVGGCIGLSFVCTCPLVDLILKRVEKIEERDHEATGDQSATREGLKKPAYSVVE